MKWQLVVGALALALGTMGARAQAGGGGLYFNPVVTRISNSTADTGPFAFLGQNGTSHVFGGVDFGGYYDVYHEPKFEIGVDLRDALEHGGGASINSFLFGVRLAGTGLAQHPRLKPYVQLSLGDGRTKSQLSAIHISKFEYDVYGGADFALNKHVDWRVIELGYGSVTTISSSIYGGPIPIPAANLVQFSTGFVFRLP